MSNVPGGAVASAVALMFAAGGVAAAEPVAERVVEAQEAPHGLCFRATEGSAERVVPDTICGRMAVPPTMCGRMVMPIGMCARATEPEEQPSTWCLIATEGVTEVQPAASLPVDRED